MSLIEKSLFSDNKAMDGGAVCLGRLAVQDFVDRYGLPGQKTSSVMPGLGHQLTRTHLVQALTMSLPFSEFSQPFHEQFRGHLRRRDFQRADQHPPRRQIAVRVLQRPFWTGRIRGTWKQHKIEVEQERVK